MQDPLPAGDWGYVDIDLLFICFVNKQRTKKVKYVTFLKLNLEVHIIDICKQIVHFGEEERDASE